MPYKNPDDLQNFSNLHTRPEPHERLFRSDEVERALTKISEKIADEDIQRMFVQCFPNTLDTTVYHSEHEGKPDTFVVTGDIPAMWLRDSVNQVWPYLRFIPKDQEVKNLFIGLLNRQSTCIISDPYANAFKREINDGRVEVWERKWELDSLAAFLRLSVGYFEQTDDTTPFDDRWLLALEKLLDVILLEQNTLDKENRELLFQFRTQGGHLHPAVRLEGYGYPSKRCGLTRCVFRPSDDECVFPYLIPSNAMTVVNLNKITKILDKIGAVETAKRVGYLAHQIDTGIREWGIVEHKEFGKVYAYEVDGFGSSCVMDDPNIPSLLSLPYLGYCKEDDEVYQNTRKLILSKWNSFFAKGERANGETSPHVGVCDHFWPMATIMQALTTKDKKEIEECLSTLKSTHAGTFFMHESVDVDNEHHFTRHWFAWVNSLFGELILTIHDSNPEILEQQFGNK
ncbi:MAG TPA: glycoside hydrolase family 125 protein [Patescibacteria group bacterium]